MTQKTYNPVQQGALLNRLKNDFTYHRPPKEVAAHFVWIRQKALELAVLISDVVPIGREQSNAFTRLEECVMHANAGIAREYPVDEPGK